MDEDTAWRALASGELLHVDHDLRVSSVLALEEPPRHQLTLADLSPHAAESQGARPTGARSK